MIEFTYGEFTPYHNEVNLNTILTNFFTPKSHLDLISTYRILSNRLACQNLDPEFARTWVKQEFEDQVKSHDRNDVYDLFSLHLYLLGNCRVMNLLTQDTPFIELTTDLTTPLPRRSINESGHFTVNDEEVDHDLDILRSHHFEIDVVNGANIEMISQQIPEYLNMIRRFLDNPIL